MSYTINDFNNFFDLAYNNVNSFKAASVNMFEKSLFLTKAYHEVIRSLLPTLDSDEKTRRKLGVLFISGSVSYDAALNVTLNGIKIDSNSKMFKLPSDIWHIGQEMIHDADNDLPVIPIRTDDYNEAKDNPFKKPNSKKAWRLSIGSNLSEPQYITEIITTITTPTKYTFRYVKEPGVIILSDLSIFGTTISGSSDPVLPEIHSSLHDTIIDRAVMLATQAYKENTLQSQMVVTNN